MTAPTTHLWFVNGSEQPGIACVYLDAGGATGNQGPPTSLAWMVTPAHPGVAVRFDWATDQCFIWSEPAPKRSQQVTGPVQPGSWVTLGCDQYGLSFGTPSAGSAGPLTIAQDGSIPATGLGVVGIGMHGAGTYAYPIGPNLRIQLNPQSPPAYRIAFGVTTAGLNQPIDPTTFPSPPASVTFPANVSTMTATVDSQNEWTVAVGEPSVGACSLQLVYEAGTGIWSGSETSA